MTNQPLVIVTWDDAEDPLKTWLDEEETQQFINEACIVKSVGFVVSKGPKYLTLMGDWIEKLGHRSRLTKIPVGAIIEIREIKEDA